MNSVIFKRLIFVISLQMLTWTSSLVGEELLFPNSDFESGTLQGWTAQGDAFTNQPTEGDNPQARNRESSLHQGKYWIGTYERFDGKSGAAGQIRGDAATGTLTSQEFTIARPYITFKIGAGNLPGETGVNLIVGDQTIELATGIDSESMITISKDVSEFIGKPARLVVFDRATGGWGHINVDNFTATDNPVVDERSKFALTPGISPEAYPDTGYDQLRRPQFHFSSRRNWLNDPNGMVYDGGKYHLFFQHNPHGTSWGNMTWGHATAPDMLHWTQHDHSLLPYSVDAQAGTIFSGTIVTDDNNSLGKQVGDPKTLVAFFTFATKPKFYQAMAYSTDLGESWTYWNEGRAVVPNQGFDNGERDPKVFWHAASQQWVMALWVQRDPGRIRFFTSDNLTDWKFASDLMRDWAFECMDVVFLPVDGDENNMKCVIYDASFDYEIGSFDGEQFTTESGPFQAGGGNFYAAQTFYNQPQGRAIQIGWMRGGPNAADLYDVPFNQQMSFPCELSLRDTDQGMRLFYQPIEEIQTLVESTHDKSDVDLPAGENLIADLAPLDLIDMTVEFDPGTATSLVFDLPGVQVTYDSATGTSTYTGVDNEGNSQIHTLLPDLKPRDGRVRLRFLVDRISLEAYAFDGEDFRAVYTSPNTAPKTNSIHAVGGTARIHVLKINRLNSIWK
ncbi:glycoside hydrolase family 32 protein [Allorhodopirellula heiligendammensis]|uniref:Levanase n=1 Tax=Allorhodopirellula heiligendammensis TaxID=2714739 RepID=A0A5C6BCT7_9BACT|nr:glycoside hydrolase family 32 protein [Allorhodopirellula heiligendammensis]TWU09858.1 Levanase precursor [Allorhodopirellula heiligendammensis]